MYLYALSFLTAIAPIKGLLSMVGSNYFLYSLTFDTVTIFAETAKLLFFNSDLDRFVWSLWNPFEIFHRK